MSLLAVSGHIRRQCESRARGDTGIFVALVEFWKYLNAQGYSKSAQARHFMPGKNIANIGVTREVQDQRGGTAALVELDQKSLMRL
jgi:hypothetical protein